jgi:hypothetical protein
MAVPRPGRPRAAIWIVICVLLAAALIATLWVPFYNHLTPALGDSPLSLLAPAVTGMCTAAADLTCR